MKRDSLGARMKAQYEDGTRYLLPRRTYTVIRVDGKSFHSYTRGCARPYDIGLMEDMDAAAKAMCENLEGAQIAYVQSDEISILLTDFATAQTEAWFDGSLQKLVSISASLVTAQFNLARMRRAQASGDAFTVSPACFDSRAFTIPDRVEVENYFIWRQQDATRNSISMTAQTYFSPTRLHGKTSDQMQEMLWQEMGINWNDMPGGFKRGRCVIRGCEIRDVLYTDKRTGERQTQAGVERAVWQVVIPPVITQDRAWLRVSLPVPPAGPD